MYDLATCHGHESHIATSSPHTKGDSADLPICVDAIPETTILSYCSPQGLLVSAECWLVD